MSHVVRLHIHFKSWTECNEVRGLQRTSHTHECHQEWDCVIDSPSVDIFLAKAATLHMSNGSSDGWLLVIGKSLPSTSESCWIKVDTLFAIVVSSSRQHWSHRVAYFNQSRGCCLFWVMTSVTQQPWTYLLQRQQSPWLCCFCMPALVRILDPINVMVSCRNQETTALAISLPVWHVNMTLSQTQKM